MALFTVIAAAFLFWGKREYPNLIFKKTDLSLQRWGISSEHLLATQAGMEILARGGNAVDAAVAVAYVLGVVEPYACGLGGGGEMLFYRRRDQQIRIIDYRETAPLVYGQRFGNPGNSGVPGFTAGMEYLLHKYGSLPRLTVMARALKLARQGFSVNQTLAALVEQYHGSKLSERKTPAFYHHGRPIRYGERLRQPDLAMQLRKIARHGKKAFYNHSFLAVLNQLDSKAGPEFVMNDFYKYQVQESTPVKADFDEFEIYAPPPPGGGLTLIEMLKLAEISGAARMGLPDETRIPLLLKGMAIAYADRRNYLGDPSYGAIIPKQITQPDYLKRRWRNYDIHMEGPENDNEQSTTHFVVVDAKGNWVSCTQTLGDFFGNGVMVNGFFLNDSMNKFSNAPDSPNRAAPGKRPYSYITPALVFKSGHPILALGSPGGRRIPAILTQMLLYHLKDGASLKEAIRRPRYFLNADRQLYFEKRPSHNILSLLKQRGFQIAPSTGPFFWGAIQALEITPQTGRLRGAADFRRDGSFSCHNP